MTAVPVLPERVRRYVVDLAAEVLGGLAEPDVPASLRRVRAFAPARRGRSGAGPLGVSLDRDGGFRQRVAAAWRERHPELAAAVDAGETPGAADPLLAAAGVFLARPPGWEPALAAWLDALAEADTAARAEESAASSGAELAAARREADRWRLEVETAEAARAELSEELARARRELRRHRADADRARAAARDAERELAEARERAGAELAARDETVRVAQARARQADEQVADTRRAAREGRTSADTRARLLLDTIVEAAAGLRRELALPPADRSPADAVAASLGGGAAGAGPLPGPGPRAQASDDPALLDELLRLPRAHLLVDGYNVTKEGWGTMPLVEQRRRLVDSLAAVAARTGAEVTCCFDGADVESRGPARVRGVRVLFSDPGVEADELIRRLVRAEPAGRVLVVVSSDGEVVSGVRSAGARAIPSAALLRLLGRG